MQEVCSHLTGRISKFAAMNFTALQIAEKLNGKIQGNPESVVNALAKIEEGKSGDLCFLSNPKYTPFIYKTKASVVIVNKDFEAEREVTPVLIFVDDAYASFSQLLSLYSQMKCDKKGVDQLSKIEQTVQLGKDVFIGAFSYIGENAKIGNNVKIYPNCFVGENVHIDDNSILFPGVKIYHDCKIGQNNVLHAGAIIGGDGFGFSPDINNQFNKISQIGNVILSHEVEVGANTTIDRATMGSTLIGKGVKLDNLIQIAHNVSIGENTVIAAKVAIGGSTKIGRNCMIGGLSAIAGHIIIADKVKIAGQSGVAASIKQEGKIVQGPMAFDIKDFQRSYIIFKKLPEIYKTITEIEKSFMLNNK
ncbi:MAG: UDP-3-O-(3-hydroxymyristoyl)glucosamine N-acyltransferase [Bacteroidota bacterium]|nr:UDP-3-O-(3-hydroxymyristoyl)glucosamine N-acyltransferase [Bacteroidota bacterium]